MFGSVLREAACSATQRAGMVNNSDQVSAAIVASAAAMAPTVEEGLRGAELPSVKRHRCIRVPNRTVQA